MVARTPLHREGTCEEQSDSSGSPHGAEADVPTCAELFHTEAITGCRSTQFWAPRPGERKGVNSRKGDDSLGPDVAPGERSECRCLAALGSRVKQFGMT